jgi:hypothetical protein
MEIQKRFREQSANILRGYTNDDEPEERVKTSNYLITISTNKRARDVSSISEIIRELYFALYHAFGNKDCVEGFIDMLDDGLGHKFHSHVGKIDSQGVIEYHHQSGVHVHVLMSICHITRVRLNEPNMKDILLSKMDIVKNLYIAIQYIRNDVQNVRNYIYKTIHGRKLRMCDGTPYPEDGDVHVTCVISIGAMGEHGFISAPVGTENPPLSDEFARVLHEKT